MKRTFAVCVVLFAAISLPMWGSDEDAKKQLIQLDQEWGNADAKHDKATLEKILATDVISVSPEGIQSREQLIAAEADAPDTPYQADEYKIVFLNKDTALMAHRVTGAGKHMSFHVWVHRDGRWQVVGTSSTPIE